MATTLEKLEAADIGETVSAVTWAENSRIELANGDIYSFKERPYLIDPLRTEARQVCVMKARGMGFSETFILKSIHGLGMGRFRQGVQYVFPTETAMREFVQSRFNVVIKKNAALRKMVQDTDTTYYKRVGLGNLFLNGGQLTINIDGAQKESMSFKGKQIDAAFIDEMDDFEESNGVIGRAMSGMKNSPLKMITAISNPTVTNYGIDKLWQVSNQNFWYRQCKSCKEHTCADKEFPNLVDKDGCHCHKCGSLLAWRGQWRPDYPERKDLYGIRSTDWEGYHLSDLNGPNDDPYSILQMYKDKSESNQENVHKYSLGRPYDASSNSLTLTEIYERCSTFIPECDKYDKPTIMGMDVGPSSGHHVVIGLRTDKDAYQILYTDCLESFDKAIEVGHKFNVQNCVVDMDPESTSCRRFQKEAGFRVWLNRYNWSNPVDEISWNQDDKTVKTYRNYIFDRSHNVIVEKKVKLPMRNRKIEEFAKQYIAPYKKKRESKHGIEYYYHSRSDNDHFRNAMNYFLVAATHSRVTRPEGTRRKVSNKAVHETVRI